MSDHLATLSVDQLTSAVSRVVTALPTPTPGGGVPLSSNQANSGSTNQHAQGSGSAGHAPGIMGPVVLPLDVGSQSASRIQTAQYLEAAQYQQFPGTVALSLQQVLQPGACGGNQLQFQPGLRPLLPAPPVTSSSTPTVASLPTNTVLTNPMSVANTTNALVALTSNQLLTNVNQTNPPSTPTIVAMPSNSIPASLLKALQMQAIQLPVVPSATYTQQHIAQSGQTPTQVLLPGGNTAVPSAVHIQSANIQPGQVQSEVGGSGATLLPVLSGQKSGTPTYILTSPGVGTHNIIQAQIAGSQPQAQNLIAVTCASTAVNISNTTKPKYVNSVTNSAPQVIQLSSLNGKGTNHGSTECLPGTLRVENSNSDCATPIHITPVNPDITQTIITSIADSINSQFVTPQATFSTCVSHAQESIVMSPSTLNHLVADHHGHAEDDNTGPDADALMSIQHIVSSVSPGNSPEPGKENHDLHSAQTVLDMMLKNDIQVSSSQCTHTTNHQNSPPNDHGNLLCSRFTTTGKYCVDCNIMYSSECPIHQGTVYEHIPDSPMLSRARMTLPVKMGFRVPVSQVGSAELLPEGIMSRVQLAKRSKFGPLVGRSLPPDEAPEAVTPGIWKIFGDEGESCVEVLDCRDPEWSNWLMYMRSAKSTQQQNVTVFQQGREIFFVTCKAVEPNTELFYWYSLEYARMIGISSCSPEEYLSCRICKKRYSEHDALLRHVKYMHTDTSSRRHKCKVCSRGFTSSTKLNTHMHVHLGLRPYKCSSCQKSFTDQSNLRTHLKIHTGEKRFHCGICDKAFRQRSHLTSHLLIHTGEKNHKCQYCSRYFARLSDLRQHELQHTQEKKFLCQHEGCNKTFSKHQNLKKHIKVHTGVKDFTCTNCSKGFYSKFHLQRHLPTCKGADSNAAGSLENKPIHALPKLPAGKKHVQKRTPPKQVVTEMPKQKIVIEIVTAKEAMSPT